MKHIEFLGTAGAGKTILMEELSNFDNYVSRYDLFDIRYWDIEYKNPLINNTLNGPCLSAQIQRVYAFYLD